MTLYLSLAQTAAKNPDAVALIENDTQMTYKELMNNINKTASLLKNLNINRDDKIGLLCLNQIEYIELFFAANKIGAISVPINSMLSEEFIKFLIDDSGIKILFVSVELSLNIPNLYSYLSHKSIKVVIVGSSPEKSTDKLWLVDLRQNSSRETETIDDINKNAVLLYTSGTTTGHPKGVLLTNDNLLTNQRDFCDVISFPQDFKCILAVPLFHSFGEIVLLVCLLNSVSTILIKQFAPGNILKAISTHKPEVLPLVPTMFDLLITTALRKEIPLTSLKYCITGGSAMSYKMIKKLIEATKGNLLEGYGITEASPVVTISNTENTFKKNSVGKPLRHVEIKITDDSEICLKGQSIFKGYHNRDEENLNAFTNDGYFKTGDTGFIDKDGFLFVTGRKKDIIIRAGENIAAKQIEDIILQCPAVKEIAIFGVPDPMLGEAIFCALEPGENFEIKEVEEICKKQLPKHMIPEKFIVLQTLPKNALGKVLKHVLKQQCQVKS